MKIAPGRDVVEQLDAGDLDDAMAGCRIEPGGFGVDHDLAHYTASPVVAQTPRRAASLRTLPAQRRDDRAQPLQAKVAV